jgi:hypothetical protein
LPDSIGMGDGEVAERESTKESFLAQHSRSSDKKVQGNNSSPPALTRVDVDARGKRTLVNAMR